jgi:protein TonB
MAYADQVHGSRRITTMAGVAIIHGVIGYAFVTGMAVNIIREVATTLTTTNIPLPVKSPEPTPPKPLERTMPQPTASSTITVVEPIMPRPASSDVVHVDTVPTFPLPTLTPTVIDTAPTASTLPSKAAGVRARGSKSAWITTDDYPPSAIRAEEQGVVGIAVTIGADGRVNGCTVTGSSGSGTLDAAACRLYQRRARFDPARDDAGNAVASSYNDRVRWELPR